MVLPRVYPKQYHLFLFRLSAEAVKSRYDCPLNLCRSVARFPESLDRSSGFSSLFLQSYSQQHILDLYGVKLLGSVHTSKAVL